MITAEELRALFKYEPETGVFTRLKTLRPAGHLTDRGYVEFSVKGRNYKAHRLAWLYMYGKFPDIGQDIDHINRNKADNRIANLRICSHIENMRNMTPSKRNKSGFKGVYWDKGKRKWAAAITIQYKVLWLGQFDTPESAHAAYCAAAEKHFGEFACTTN